MAAGRVVDGWRATYGASGEDEARRAVQHCAKWVEAKPGRMVRTRRGEPEHGEPGFIVETMEVG